MNDITVGEGSFGNSATLCRDLDREKHAYHKPCISENNVSYWISWKLLDCDCDLKVMKDTPEGREIAKMLASKKTSNQVIMNYLDKLVFASLSPAAIRSKIDGIAERAYMRGREFQAARVRSVLGEV